MGEAPHSLGRRLRYAAAVLRRFRSTLLLGALLFGVVPFVFVFQYPRVAPGELVSFGKALHHVYFLLFGQPSLNYVDDFLIEFLNIVIPPFGLVTVVDGVVRFSYLFNARARLDKEWIEVIAETMSGHVIICGAGRVGYRVALELRKLNREVIVIEKRADARFSAILRDLKIPVLIDDIRSPAVLERVNAQVAEAIVCATDDDLSNLNVGLDARKVNPGIRVVLRLFDDDLVQRVRDNFAAEAHSTTALAAPALALAALDPRIVHSFHIGPHLMVVAGVQVTPKLAALTLSQLRDDHGCLTLSLSRGHAPEVLHPQGHTTLQPGDALVVQGRYPDYLALLAFLGEEKPPLSRGAPAAP